MAKINKFNRSFTGRLNGYNINDLKAMLNWQLNDLSDRLEIIDKIESTGFFTKYNDEYYKVALNQKDGLSDENNVFQFIESLANYILFCPEVKQVAKDRAFDNPFNNRTSKELSEIVAVSVNARDDKERMSIDDFNMYQVNTSHYDNDEVEKPILQYKLDISQRILASDYKDDDFFIKQANGEDTHVLQDYKRLYDAIGKSNDKKINRYKSKIMEDMILAKNGIKRPIYFKRLLPDSCEFDSNQFSMKEIEHIKAVLMVGRKPLSHWLGADSQVIYTIIDKIKHKLDEDELDFIKTAPIVSGFRMADWQNFVVKTKDCDISFEYSYTDITNMATSIAKKVQRYYMETKFDWYFTEMIKGTYKRCVKCGEVKLLQMYYDDKRKNMGKKNECKSCFGGKK